MIAVTIILSVLGFFLRRSQLNTVFDAIGVIPGSKMPLVWVAIAAVILFAVLSFLLRGRKKYQALSSTRMLPMAGGVAAGLLMLVSGLIIGLSSTRTTTDLLIGLGSILTGLCWVGTSVLRHKGARIHPVLFLVPVAFFIVELVCRFRFWTRDPVILDYCFDLFALIASMCAMLHLSSYCFDQGSRRATVFFAYCGIFFSAVAMAGAPMSELLGYLAVALWLMVQLWLLLRPMPRKRRGEEE